MSKTTVSGFAVLIIIFSLAVKPYTPQWLHFWIVGTALGLSIGTVITKTEINKDE